MSHNKRKSSDSSNNTSAIGADSSGRTETGDIETGDTVVVGGTRETGGPTNSLTSTGNDSRELERLWKLYKEEGDIHARDRLIIYYSPLVKYVAARLASGLPRNIEQSDLVSYGIMGLIDAINKFDLSRNVKFETYSMIRIKGAIIDELRALDWVPRSVRTKSKILEAVYAKLEGTLMRMPTDSEVCAELGIDEVELTDMLRDISLIGIVPLDQTLSHREEAATLGDTMADTDDGPLPMLEVKEVRETLVNIIKQMGSREKTVLTLYYYEGMTLEEIGKVLGVTESRVCQIHTKAVLQLRAKLTTARKMEVQ